MVMVSQEVHQAETGAPAEANDAAAASFCSRCAAAERRLTCIHMYTHTYIHFYYIYICYKYLHTAHMVTFQMLRLYTLILTITTKDTFL